MLHALATAAFLVAQASKPQAITPDQLQFFESTIRPILVDQCYGCHSAQSGRARGGYLVDTRDGARKGGGSGPGIVPGKPDDSLLIQAVRYHDEDLQMPPKGKLSEDQIKALERWVAMGAPDPREAATAKPKPRPITNSLSAFSRVSGSSDQSACDACVSASGRASRAEPNTPSFCQAATTRAPATNWQR